MLWTALLSVGAIAFFWFVVVALFERFLATA
jgi:hypothetical protein